MELQDVLITTAKYQTHTIQEFQAPHSEYSGNVTAVLPTKSGDIVVGDAGSAISQNVNTTGIITATSFVGEGSGIHGLNISEFDLGMFGM